MDDARLARNAADQRQGGRSLPKGEGAVDIEVASREKQLLAGTVEMRGSLPGLPVAPGEATVPWTASTKMRLAEFPLKRWALFPTSAKGFVSGELAVDDVHEDARAKAQIALRELQLGRARSAGNAKIDFDGRTLRAALRLDRRFSAKRSAARYALGQDMAPTVVTEEPAFATLKTNRLRAAALLPLPPAR
jgi:hypothetical protein